MAYAVTEKPGKTNGRFFVRSADTKEDYNALYKNEAMTTILSDGFTEIGENLQDGFIFEIVKGNEETTGNGNIFNTFEIVNIELNNFALSADNKSFLSGLKNSFVDIVYLDLDNLSIRCVWETYFLFFEKCKGGEIPIYYISSKKTVFNANDYEIFDILPPLGIDKIFFIGNFITPPVTITDNLFFLGDLVAVAPPTITYNIIDNTIEME